MDVPGLQRWYASYLEDFRALVRGDVQDPQAFLRHYGAPVLMCSDAGTTVLADERQALAHLQPQLARLRADGYDRSEQLDGESAVLNRVCGTHRARLVRLRADGTEIARFEATYLVTSGAGGLRIAAVVAHSAG